MMPNTIIDVVKANNVQAILDTHYLGSIDAYDENKLTAMHWAVMLRYNDCMEALLRSGAQPDLRNKANLTPSDYATKFDNQWALQYIRLYLL